MSLQTMNPDPGAMLIGSEDDPLTFPPAPGESTSPDFSLSLFPPPGWNEVDNTTASEPILELENSNFDFDNDQPILHEGIEAIDRTPPLPVGTALGQDINLGPGVVSLDRPEVVRVPCHEPLVS